MRQINCYIPITVRVTGRPGDAQLDELAEALMRALAARIAFAEQTLSNGREVPGEWIIEEMREYTDTSRLHGETYEVPAYDRGGRRQRVAIHSSAVRQQPELPLLSDFHDYAFFFTGGSYGQAAEAFIRQFYPEHHRYQARSFEQMFRILARDIRRRTRRSGRRVRVSEIVIVTHANAAGGMKIPLTQDRRRRTFTPWDLVDLQREFRRGLHQRFRRERREVVAALTESTQIIVRGCNFGQSQDALDALRLFFGGQPIVFAPRGFQGFEVLRVGGSLLRTPEQAFDFLVEQGYLPPDQKDIPPEEKRRYIRNVFGGRIPAEFFVTSEEDYKRFKELPRRQRLGPEAEALIRRPFEPDEPDIDASIPSGGRFWSFSAPSLLGSDPELDRLSIDEMVARAQRLNNPYRPQNAAMLLRLRAAWERKSLEQRLSAVDTGDPLAGLPDVTIFGDPDLLSLDAARYPGAALPPRDIFEEEDLPFRVPTREQREQARDFEELERVFEATASVNLPEVRERTFSSRGQVETLSDGIRLWNFAVGSARLRSQFHAPLQDVAQQAQANPDLIVRVDGYTSSSGSPRTNERLSRERALAVVQFLIDAGVPAWRVEARGHGERNLLVQERGRDGSLIPRRMARNRRVDIRLVARTGMPRVTGGLESPAEVLRRARQRGQILGREGRRERREDDPDPVGAGLSIAEITATVISEVVEQFAVRFISGMASWVFSFINLIHTLHQARTQQIRAARKLGIRLGLRAATEYLSSSGQLAGDVTVRALEAGIHRSFWLEREWLAQITYSYPLGPDGARRHMRQGIARVAQEINRAMRWAEADFRSRLRRAGLPPPDVERMFNEEIDDLRRQLLEALIRGGLQALR